MISNQMTYPMMMTHQVTMAQQLEKYKIRKGKQNKKIANKLQ